MSAEFIQHAIVNEDGDVICIARVLGTAGALITQASVASIAMTVTQLDDNGDSTGTPTTGVPVIASVVYDTAQTSATMWPTNLHPDGYNFLCRVPASHFAVGGARYAIEFQFTMATAVDHFGASTAPLIQLPFGVLTRKIHRS